MRPCSQYVSSSQNLEKTPMEEVWGKVKEFKGTRVTDLALSLVSHVVNPNLRRQMIADFFCTQEHDAENVNWEEANESKSAIYTVYRALPIIEERLKIHCEANLRCNFLVYISETKCRNSCNHLITPKRL